MQNRRLWVESEKRWVSLRLSSQGRLFTCLMDNSGHDLLTPLRAGDEEAVRGLEAVAAPEVGVAGAVEIDPRAARVGDIGFSKEGAATVRLPAGFVAQRRRGLPDRVERVDGRLPADLALHERDREIVQGGLKILENIDHRGAVGADPNDGDGAGILIQIPDAFFREEMAKLGVKLPPAGIAGTRVWVATLDFQPEPAFADALRALCAPFKRSAAAKKTP